ncbi:MAG: cytidylate kinase-like family protein [Lachnospiraceae bacterium]|nr:cytidylate kinase-like family protein [Lachnospiraceae bacterium]
MMKKCICIGREYGSGGREIGEKLADRLQVACYDKLLLQLSAKESGLSMETMEKDDEKPARMNSFLSGNVFADSANMGNQFYSLNQKIYTSERNVIEKIAGRESAVIIGRCASDIIQQDRRLSVFIYADMKDRLARVAKRNEISEREAALRIRRIDRMRKQYFDFNAGSRWGHPESYDLMLSSSYYEIHGCIEIILKALEQEEQRDE